MKKPLLLLALLLSFAILNSAQSLSLKEDKLPYSVGFETFLWSDNSRQFKFNNRPNPVNRPIRAYIWYPTAISKNSNFLSFADYVYASVLTKEPNQLTAEEKNELQKTLFLTLSFFSVSPDQVANLMAGKTNAVPNAPKSKGKFPLLVFGNVEEGFYYTTVAEYLAANGYVVMTLPSLGANENEPCGYDLNCLKHQQTDMEFAIEKMRGFANVDASKIGLVAWSFSGLSVAHLPMKNQAVKAVVSLDAATGYQYGKGILAQSKELEMTKTNLPFLHFHGLAGNARVPKNFEFFNSYQSTEKRLVTFKNLQHSDFISLYGIGVRFAKNDNQAKPLEAIRWVNLITLNFLDAHLKNNRKSSKFLNDALKNDDQSTVEIFSFAKSYQN